MNLYQEVPAAEELPEKNKKVIVMNIGQWVSEGLLRESGIWTINKTLRLTADNSKPTHWLRPLRIALPEEVSDDRLRSKSESDQVRTMPSHYQQGFFAGQFAGMRHVRDNFLLPYIAANEALTKRVKELEEGKAEVVRVYEEQLKVEANEQINLSEELGSTHSRIAKLEEALMQTEKTLKDWNKNTGVWKSLREKIRAALTK